MQVMAYDANAYIVTAYYDYLQAYNSDRFTGFVPQPQPDGAILFQYGTYSYMNIAPPTEEEETAATAGEQDSSDEGMSTGLMIAGAAGVVAVAGLALAARRRSTRGDVE
jgi:peptide/nickel transport system substrate-binding protein